MNKDHAIGFGIGLLAGAVIGGAIALLYAPKTGQETRKLIKDKAAEVVNTVRSAATEAKWKAEDAIHALKS